MRLFSPFAVLALAAAILSTHATASAQVDAPAATDTKPDVKLFLDVEYANVGGQSLKLDVGVPQGLAEKPPLVVWIHGGGWVQGNKANPPIVYLAKRGYALASISYRFSDKATYPAQIHDCKGAIRFLRAHADKYGYDPERIGVAGGSAGGHLAALLGTTGGDKTLEGDVGGNVEQSSRVQAVVDVYGPTDLLLDETNGGEKWNPRATDLVGKLLGGPRQEKAELARSASPVYYVSEDDPPFLLIHGDKDDLVFLSQSKRLLNALEETKIPARLEVVENAGHGGPAFNDARRQGLIGDFFDAHLKPAPKR